MRDTSMIAFGLLIAFGILVWPLLPPRSERMRRLLGELPPTPPRNLTEESRCYATLNRGACPSCGSTDTGFFYNIDITIVGCHGCGSVYRVDIESRTARPIQSRVVAP